MISVCIVCCENNKTQQLQCPCQVCSDCFLIYVQVHKNKNYYHSVKSIKTWLIYHVQETVVKSSLLRNSP